MELAVQKREKFGKDVKMIRRQGLIPAELYGRGLENLHLAVPVNDFKRVFKSAGESTLITLVVGSEERPAMIYDIARDPLTDEITNIDFYQVRLDEKIKVKIPLNFVGEAPAVKDKGGLLVKAMHEIEIEALPASLPHALDVDISGLLEINSSVRVSDLKLPKDVRLLIDGKTVIATVIEKPTEEELAPAPEIAVDSVKVETEEKKVERAAKKEAAGEEKAPEPAK